MVPTGDAPSARQTRRAQYTHSGTNITTRPGAPPGCRSVDAAGGANRHDIPPQQVVEQHRPARQPDGRAHREQRHIQATRDHPAVDCVSSCAD